MVRPGQRRADARRVAWAIAALLAALATGCTTSNTSNASLTTSTSAGPTIAFESIDGPPVGIFNRLVDNLSSEAQARNLAIASREGACSAARPRALRLDFRHSCTTLWRDAEVCASRHRPIFG